MARTDSNQTTRRRIGDIFYETRVLMGREYTLARFADEVLEGALDPVMLGYVEKGKRFPNEALVRRLAQVRGQDARELLAVLARDRIAKTIGREIRKLLETPKAVDAIEDAELAARVSRAIAALPDDGSWIEQADWRVEYSAPAGRSKREQPLDAARAERIEALLLEQEVVEVADGRVRRHRRDYEPTDPVERQSLALDYCLLFLKGLLDELALADVDTGTYLRNHYLNIERSRIGEFEDRLHESLRVLAEEFAVDKSDTSEFLNVLVAATLY